MKDGFWAHTIGWFTALLGGMTAEKWAIFVGITCSVGTFFVNWTYQRKQLKAVKERFNE